MSRKDEIAAETGSKPSMLLNSYSYTQISADNYVCSHSC